MSRLKIEAFLSTPPCPNCLALIELLNEISEENNEKVELIIYKGPNEAFERYQLTAFPAVVVEELIKMVGFCPSKESLLAALKELGVE